jgi:hypothetical protein
LQAKFEYNGNLNLDDDDDENDDFELDLDRSPTEFVAILSSEVEEVEENLSELELTYCHQKLEAYVQ